MTEIENLQDRLKGGNDAFKAASADGGFSVDWPPDGTYQGLVRKFDFFEGKKSGDVFVKTVLEVAHDREHQGREVETIHNLTDPERMDWLKTHLSRLGAPVDEIDLTDVAPGSQLLAELLDTPVEFVIKTADRKNEDTGENYRNVFVNKRLGDPLNPGVLGGPMSGGKVQSQSDVPADDSDLTPQQVEADERIPF